MPGGPAWLTRTPPGEPQVMMMRSTATVNRCAALGTIDELPDKWRLWSLHCRKCGAKWVAAGVKRYRPCLYCGSRHVDALPTEEEQR